MTVALLFLHLIFSCCLFMAQKTNDCNTQYYSIRMLIAKTFVQNPLTSR